MKSGEVKKQLEELRDEAVNIFYQAVKHANPERVQQIKAADAAKPVNQLYQNWYARVLRIVKALMPERYGEFVACYEPDPKRKETDWLNYTIKDYLLGLSVTRAGRQVFDPLGAFEAKMQHQITIVRALRATFDQRIQSVEAVLRVGLLDDELQAADDLFRKGHLRAAGAVAGVVLESHLGAYASSKEIKISKKDPTIADLNESLKSQGIIDIPVWRHIQRLADIRNLCVHSKGRDPTNDEIPPC
jgi:hypothetical protein